MIGCSFLENINNFILILIDNLKSNIILLLWCKNIKKTIQCSIKSRFGDMISNKIPQETTFSRKIFFNNGHCQFSNTTIINIIKLQFYFNHVAYLPLLQFV